MGNTGATTGNLGGTSRLDNGGNKDGLLGPSRSHFGSIEGNCFSGTDNVDEAIGIGGVDKRNADVSRDSNRRAYWVAHWSIVAKSTAT